MPNLYQIARPVLWRLPTESAHRVALCALRAGLGIFVTTKTARAASPPILRQQLWNLTFPNPIGVAAGFDKDGFAPDKILKLGFGSVEVGTVTPKEQRGNVGDRLFRLDQDAAIINRMGFPSRGLSLVVTRLNRGSRRGQGILGVNLGKNRKTVDAVVDYAEGIRRTAALADYLVINISSPNTPGLRDLQRREPLEALLRQLIAVRNAGKQRPPLLVKIAPDLAEEELADVAAVASATGIDGIIIANTTTNRPETLQSISSNKQGGLSGPPLFSRSTELLGSMYRLTNGRIPLIGVGGVNSAESAYAKIRAGASLVQLHTALIFHGMNLIAELKSGLVQLLHADGFTNISQAVGADHPDIAQPDLTSAGPITFAQKPESSQRTRWPVIGRKGRFIASKRPA
jgi:dihydroorotate dehydrogenase